MKLEKLSKGNGVCVVSYSAIKCKLPPITAAFENVVLELLTFIYN